jgi:ERF superfamily
MEQQTLIVEGKVQPVGSALQVATPTPMDLLQMAVQKGVDIEQLTKLMELKERWEANEARKAFVDAMAEFKRESIVIIRDKTNKQYESKYVSLGNLVNTVTPYLSKHGLSATWSVDQTSAIKVSCTIRHSLGHSESVSMTVPPDTSGAKNPIQQIKSAITYAKACTFESACGLASTDANVDDDGNGSGFGKMTDLAERLEFIDNCRNRAELKSIYTASYEKAEQLGDTNAKRALYEAKNAKYKELGQ